MDEARSLFPHGFDSWEGNNAAANPSVVLLPSIWVIGAFWVYYKICILNNWLRKMVLDVSNCAGPLRANFLSAKLVLDNGWKEPSSIFLKQKNDSTPVLTFFGIHFVNNELIHAYPRPARSRESFQATHFVDWGPAFCKEKYQGHY